jgi:MoaA/NifB/PqqE/SkfB family radical SAM enzyme
MKREQGFMSSETFRKVINELALHQTAIRFVRWGEPLIHPDLLKFIKYAKAVGLMCHLNTNGSLADSEFLGSIIKLKLDSIKFSFQGANQKEYRKIRDTDYFDALVATVQELHSRRGGRKKPFIQVGTTVENPDSVSAEFFKKAMRAYCDKVVVGKTKNLFSDTVGNKPNPCPELFDKMSINWDGTVSACCADYDNFMLVGDVNKLSLQDIWLYSTELQDYRQAIANSEYTKHPLCRRCEL